MRLIAVGLLLAGAASGCVDPAPWAGDGHCGPTSTDLFWKQAGLYDAFVSAMPGATWSAGGAALPWENSWDNVTGLKLGHLSLKLMQPTFHTRGNIAFADPHLSHVELTRDGVVRAFVEGDVADEIVLAAFHRMAANASSASANDIDAAPRHFLASKRDAGSRSAVPLDDDGKEFAEMVHWVHEAPLPGPLRLDDLVAGLHVPFPTGESVGQASATAGNWTLGFTVPVWTLAGPQGRSLAVDPRGHASYDGGDAHDGTVPGLKAGAQDLAAAAGLPTLMLDGAGASTYIC